MANAETHGVQLVFNQAKADNGHLVFGADDLAGVELIFDLPATTHGHLVFGSDYSAPRNDLSVFATLPLPEVEINFTPPAEATLWAEIPGLVFSGDVRYASQTQRPMVGQTAHRWQESQPHENGVRHGQQDAASTPAGWETLWQSAQRNGQAVHHRLPPALSFLESRNGFIFQRATHSSDTTLARHQNGDRVKLARQAQFQNAWRLRDTTRFRYQDSTRIKSVRKGPYQNAQRLNQRQLSDFKKATSAVKGWQIGYQDGCQPLAGVWIVPEPPKPTPCYTPNAHLVFSALGPSDGRFWFVCENHISPPLPPDGGAVVVPIRRVYLVQNNVSLKRVQGGAIIPALSLGLNIDADSWTWAFSATLPAQALSDVEPVNGQPVELEASVNGNLYRVLVEQIGRDRSFGSTAIRIRGRGRSALLAAPYAPVMSFVNPEQRTAQQLMGDVLKINGVSLGWDINWKITDWVVPERGFQVSGTYVDALNAIASAAGAYIQPHPSQDSFTVQSRYPVAPWEWGSVIPQCEIPSDVALRESIEWRDKPKYNRVFVSGEGRGVMGQVTRSGTAGDLVAPMVTDALITHADAARQRGLSILADTGRQALVSISLPVLPETGIIAPGKFVRYTDGGLARIGLSRSVSVEASGPVALSQSVMLETHE